MGLVEVWSRSWTWCFTNVGYCEQVQLVVLMRVNKYAWTPPDTRDAQREAGNASAAYAWHGSFVSTSVVIMFVLVRE
jgi:hypothetical protein